MTTTHSLTYTVTFGDCDPAGIVFYPNIYGWFDRTFHDWLAGFGGHQAICTELGAIGLGLMQADAKFRRPMQPNDTVTIAMTVRDWGRKALVLGYEVTMGETVMATGEEVRGMFKRTEQGLSAGEMAALKALLER
ncbi:acyl-CoA thioesterase [Pararhodobacter zhoushanensis]|uniref:Acyl-CoA thioesterase n=1 Tax=Pararhodobacter zhoushanensis TaxID=2479545 RepID=A0ABT3GTX7_9RHOB|nr:acyl-CoA thioesterase [Pararhodobacter zhoushanensis]MCW1930983.1 acyl-CoA thioesterase [Pararhodobacter zhoushanensis]